MVESIVKGTCGIYCITFECGKQYVGQSKDCRRRILRHINSLKKGTHENPFMQKVFTKRGIMNVEILEECSKDSLTPREQFYLDNRPFVLNINRKASFCTF